MNKYFLFILSFIVVIGLIVPIKSSDSHHKTHRHHKKVHYLYKEGERYYVKNLKSDEQIVESSWIARATWNQNDYNITGWSILEIETNENISALDQAFSAGLLEGHLTKDLIALHLLNLNDVLCNATTDLCSQVYEFMANNFKWMNYQILSNLDDPYWYQVNLVLTQFNGLYHGYDQYFSKSHSILSFPELLTKKESNFIKLLSLQAIPDIEELLFKFSNTFDPFWASACSALIKVLNGNSDIYVGHNTWEQYEFMLRTAKRYTFHYNFNSRTPLLVPGHTVSFSSYPGTLISYDDFYVTSSNLAIIETTIGNSNVDLWKYVTPESNLCWIRTLIANRLSYSAVDWVKWYSMYNSGTYNNQWMIIDYNKFIPGMPLQDNLFMVLEQIPGHIMWHDQTDVLRKNSYWASYNLPSYDAINNISGVYNNSLKYGPLFSHDHSPRANIFRRDHHNVVDMNSMIKLMRYNNFTKEPFSRCDECNPPYSSYLTISARTDLNPINGTCKYPELGHRNHGATDLKIANFEMSKNTEFIGISGPTYDDVPPFVWSKTDFGKTTNHFGHPDEFKFQPYHFKWSF